MLSILVCGITSADVTIHFASSIIQMQTELGRTPDVAVTFEFFKTVDEALTHFHRDTQCDVCVVIDGQLGVTHGFILRNDMSKPCVVASYPLRIIDWARVREKLVDSGEPSSHVGMRYNYDPAQAIPEPGGKLLRILPGSEVQFKMFKITRDALNSLITRHKDTVQGDSGDLVIFSGGIIDGKKVTADQRFVRLWGESLYADISEMTKNAGPYDFVGAVGNQKQLR